MVARRSGGSHHRCRLELYYQLHDHLATSGLTCRSQIRGDRRHSPLLRSSCYPEPALRNAVTVPLCNAGFLVNMRDHAIALAPAV